jgi:peptidoglycan/LPS O-acetylase OafA/YrhL
MEDKGRLVFIDNIRIFLILLVIAHHTGQAYAQTGGWWAYDNPERLPDLGLFFKVNRSFFMSLFFMISGYFMPYSFDHKGAHKFLRDRFRRFGIPLLFFLFLVIPVEHYAYFLNFRHYGNISFGLYYLNYYLGLGVKPTDWTGPKWPEVNFGHLWFIEHLLVFAIGYTILRLIWKRSPQMIPDAAPPKHQQIIIFTVAIAIMSFIIRLWYPIDKWIGFLKIIQTAFADVPRDLNWRLSAKEHFH